MNSSISVLIGLIIGYTIIFSFIIYNDYKIDTKQKSEKYIKGKYKDFIKQFYESNLIIDEEISYDWFENEETQSLVNGYIIRFNNIGMILNFIDFYKSELFLRKKAKEHQKKRK